MAKSVLITGAGSGIGAATTQILAQETEFELLLVGRTLKKLQDVHALLPNQGKHKYTTCDIGDKADIRHAFDNFSMSNRQLCGVFANAGVGGENHYGDDDRWEAIMHTNLTGTYLTIMESLPHLQSFKDGYKNIIITSSCLARFGVPNYTAYCASKTGLLGLTRSLAVQYGEEKILVNAICPGWVETEMAKEGIQKLADHSNISYEESHREQADILPTKKMSQPEEIGKLVKYLLLDQTSITGQAIDINNGSFMI